MMNRVKLRGKPFLTLNAGHYCDQITDGLLSEICAAEGRGSLDSVVDEVYAESNPAGAPHPS
jgi:hypothetical protein